jgi:transposase
VLTASHRSEPLLTENAELSARLKVLDRINAERADENRALRQENERLTERAVLLEEEVRWLKAQFFGRSSERSADVSPDQKRLFNEAEVLAAIEAAEAAAAERTTQVGAHERKRRGHRKAIPDHFPRQVIEHDLADDEKRCPHDDTPLVRFGEETSERYHYEPPKITVERHVRPKYGCPTCREGVKIAPAPATLLPKSLASPSLLAHVIASKFVDGLPIHRIHRQLKRQRLELGTGTLGGWVNTVGADKVVPLIHLMHEALLSAPLVAMDETAVQVLKSDKAPSSDHYMVVRVAGCAGATGGTGATGPPGRRLVLFDYVPSRTAEALKDRLRGPAGPYAGKLLTDGLELYDYVAEDFGLIHFGCLTHCRRYYKQAQKVSELPSGQSLARIAVDDYIGPVYRVERQIKALREQRERVEEPLTLEEIHAIRQQRSAPVMAAFRQWVDELLPGVAPKGALGKALAYTTNQWEKLSRFLDHPDVPVDNNYCENQIRPFAVGRRAWLFADTQHGARASANLYSLVMSAQANGVEPYAYLRQVFERLPSARTVEDLEALLPWNVKAELKRQPA